ncbi:MAG: DUF6492 family protein [Pseudomonadota bacterium]
MSILKQTRQRLELHWGKQVLSRFVRDDEPDDQPVALMIPVAPKDLDRARQSVPRMQAMVAHRLVRTAVIAPANQAIKALCEEIGVDFIDENDHLTALAGAERTSRMRGWLKQQLLKLSAPEIMEHPDVVVIDSDTYPLRPTAFLTPDGRQILYRGDRNLINFHMFTERVIGPAPGRATSFIAHCMLFRDRHLDALRSVIEARHNEGWVEAFLRLIDESMKSGAADEYDIYSEYDIYGHFILRDAPDQFVTRYYANAKLQSDDFLGTLNLPQKVRRFRFVSNHERGD